VIKSPRRTARGTEIVAAADQEIAEAIAQEIHEGKYPPGSRLPTVEKLAERYAVSTATIHFAIRELKRLNLVRTVQGGGMWVVDGEPNGDNGDEDAA